MTRSAYLPECPIPPFAPNPRSSPLRRVLFSRGWRAICMAASKDSWSTILPMRWTTYFAALPLTMAFEPLPRRCEHQQSSMHPIELRVLSAFESVNLRIPFHGQRRRAWRCLSFRPCAYSSSLVSGARACACARACADVFPCHVPARERVCLVTFVVAPTGRRPRVSYLHAGRTGSVHMAA